MAAWQILFCLTVFSFLCRAFIPLGYMPDLSGERNTPFAITLCAMGGPVVMQVDLSGDPLSEPSDQSYSGDTCPYGISVTHTLMPGQAAPSLAGEVSFVSFAPPQRNQALPPLPALGPPLGSRAPPLGPGWLLA